MKRIIERKEKEFNFKSQVDNSRFLLFTTNPISMKLRIIIILFLSFVSISSLIAQVNQHTTANNSVHPGSTYAVIVGISKYENAGITQLDYAHKDAQVFADYLKSKAGGSVPEDNIRLLLNENATYGAIYDALNWLLETTHKDDLVYFYFSGHGDMENNTIYKLGFLLSYNTPRINYINNAVRIEDLNNIANTLSVNNKAKVVLITDACHSGKLAGSDFRGTFLVGEQLRAVQKSEIRITSCAPDQLSMEDQGWGGGRGVFSYYLINGLEGLADYGHDGVVTVNEIKNYLDTSLSSDALLNERAHKQNAVITGVDNLRLASVDNATLASLKKGTSSVIVGQSAGTFFKPLPVQPQTYLFNLIGKDNLEELIDFNKLAALSKEEIPFSFIQMLVDTLQKKSNGHSDDTLKDNIDYEKIALLEKTVHNNKDALKRFNDKLVVLLSDRGQEVINLYLNGDEAELERRRYYNSNSNGYDIYPKMFSVALKLTTPENYLYRILQVKLHYFAGVAARLKIPLVENPKSLLDTAMMEQKKALQLEENAAYIQNELGILYNYRKEYSIAEQYYLRATQIAPAWAIPWSNLIGLYGNMKNYKKAIEASQKAKELQADFQGIYMSSGVVYERTGNLLLAEELFRKSIKMNSRHYFPFERLGYVYTNTTQYALADSFFYEAEKRKKGYHFLKPDDNIWIPPLDNLIMAPSICLFDKNDVNKDDVMGNFVWGLLSDEAGDTDLAEKKFKQVIALDKTNPLAFHYLGRLLYRQKRWQEADIIFNYALNYHLERDAFQHYYDSLAKHLPSTKSKECILWKFNTSYYDKINDHYFLGTLYEFWSHFAEAEGHYRDIINIDPVFIGGYYKLWQMLERIGRYKEAENVLRSYAFTNKESGSPELNSFYKRMMDRFPTDAEWYYKAGLLLYQLAADNPDSYSIDKKKIDPDTDIEKYLIGIKDFTKPEIVQQSHERVFLPGIIEQVFFSDLITYPRTEGIAYLKKADSLLQDDTIKADINYKIGDLYAWQGIIERSLPYYKKSVDYVPGNANARLRLIDACSLTYHFSDALEQLDSLYQRHEINFPKQVLMAKYCIHAGRFSDALKLLKDAKQIHPYKILEIIDLNGRLQLLSNHPKEALPFYKDYLTNDSTNYLTRYTIARLYAQMKNINEAWKWLKSSIDKGFNYYWVLKYDSAWNDYRNLQQWKDITAKIPVPEVTEY
jgi:Tfp pilus assembly protein PilF